MQFACTDTDFSAEAVAESVSKAGGTVVIYSGRVYSVHKVISIFAIFRNYTVSMMRAVGVDGIYGFIYGRDFLYRHHGV